MKLTSGKHTEKAEENRRNWERLMKKLRKEREEPLLDKLAFLEKKGDKPSYIR
jgi:hypothetical protein